MQQDEIWLAYMLGKPLGRHGHLGIVIGDRTRLLAGLLTE